MGTSKGVFSGRSARPWAVGVSLVLFSVVLGLLAAETAARFLYRAPWYDRLVAEQGAHERHGYQLNSWGLRGADFTVPKPPDQVRILVLGDSFTFGIGVPRDEALFTKIIEQRLNERALQPAAGRVEVLNGGLPGGLTKHWLALWRQVGPAFDPDVVLMVFFLRDGTRTASIPEFFDVIRRELVSRNRQSFLYRHSFFYRMLRDPFDRLAVADRYTRRFRASYFGDEEQTAEWRRAQENILLIRDLVRERSAVVGLVIFPVLVELNEDYPFREICERVEEFARRNGMPVHNLLPAFMGLKAPELWASSLDQHPNERGHAIAADSLIPFVTALLQERTSAKSGESRAAGTASPPTQQELSPRVGLSTFPRRSR